MTNNPFYSRIARDSAWFSDKQQIVSKVPEPWLPWLTDQGSLTSALIEFSNDQFRVNVLSEHLGKPLPHEAETLKIPLELEARIREVELVCNQEVVVFARSVIPLAMYEAELATFKEMGSKPLGHLLFKDGRARNRQRSVSIYAGEDEDTVYGRSTPYQYHGGEILVSEFFINPCLIAT